MWLLSFAALLVPSAYAEELPVHLLTDDVSIEQTIAESPSHAHADVTGNGTTMNLQYSSQSPLNIFIIPKGATAFQTIATVLPAGTNTTVSIDLSISSAWSPGTTSYRLYFFGDANAGAQFHDIEFTEASFGSTILAGLRQISTVLPYSPASYHRITPYAVFGISLIPIAGLILLLLFSWASIRKLGFAFGVVLAVLLVTDLRFTVDATMYATDHMYYWLSNRIYASAGSLPEIGKDLQNTTATSALLCNTGTTYAEKALQYHAYPVIIGGDDPEYIVIHKSADWSVDGNILHCGSSTFTVTKEKEYSDGSILYHIES